MPIIVDTGVDNAGLRAGLTQAESMIDAAVRKMGTRLSTVGAGFGSGVQLAVGRLGQLNQATTHMERMVNVSGRLNQSLDKMSGMFNSALGIGATLGGFGLLTAAFTRSIEKAREFQTAQIAIAATLQSVYKIVGTGGKALSGPEAFQFSMQQAQRFNLEIIQRQAKNILVYQEQLGAFQSSLAAGGRKGMTPREVMDVSESAAIVAKTLGLRGEQIANASRLLMGGGVNVGRSTIGRALGVSNVDITTRSGGELVDFLKEKMKGFQSPEIQQTFAKSIEGIMSTLESKFDIFWAKVGQGFMKSISPALEELGAALQGTDAAQFAGTLSQLFLSLFKALEAIVRSPAIPVLMKFVEFLANYGDKIIIGAILLKLVGILGSAGSGIMRFTSTLATLSATALETTAAINTTTASIERASAAGSGGGGMMGGVPMTGRVGAKAAASEVAALETSGIIGLTAAQEAAILKIKATQGAATAEKLAKGMITRRVQIGQLPGSALQQFERGGGFGPFGPGFTRSGAVIEGSAAEAAMLAGTVAIPVPMLQRQGLAGLTPLTSRAGLKSLGPEMAGIGSKLLSKALPALLLGGGIELGSSALGLKKTPTGAGITDVLAGGATGAMMGSSFGPVGIAVGALAGIITGGGKVLSGAVGRVKNELDTAISNLAEIRTKFPTATKMVDLKTEEAEIRAQMHGGKPRKSSSYKASLGAMLFASAQYTLGLSSEMPDVGIDEGPTSQLTQRTLAGALQRNQEKQKNLKDMASARFEAQTKATAATEALKRIQESQKTTAMGYGPGVAAQQIKLTGQEEMAQLNVAYTGGTLGTSDADLTARAKTIQTRIDKMRAESQKRENENVQLTETEKTKIAQVNKELKDELQKLIDTQYNRLVKQIPERAKDKLAGLELDKRSRTAELDIRPIQGDYLRGRIAVEKQVLGQKELLGADYESHLKTALKNFDLTFNRPLKKIENDLKNLQFGVETEHPIDKLKLGFKALTAKIVEAIQQHQISFDTASTYFAEAATQNQADIRLAQWQRTHEAQLGKTPVERLRNRGESLIAEREAQYQGKVAQRQGHPITEGMWGTVAGLEQQRQTDQFMSQRQFEKSKQQQIALAQRSAQARMEMWSVEQEQKKQQLLQAQYGAEGARFGAKTYGWNVQTDEEQRTQADVDKQIREKILSKRRQEGLPSIRERVETGVAQYDLGKKQAESAAVAAEASFAGAKIQDQLTKANEQILGIDLPSVMEDYKQAMLAATNYLQNMVGDEKIPNTKTPIQTVTNAKGEKVLTNAPEKYTAEIKIEKTDITQTDIDRWIPAIKTALCKLVGQSNSRG